MKMNPFFWGLLIGMILLTGCGSTPTQPLGLLTMKPIPIDTLSDKEVPKVLQKDSDAVCFFTYKGAKAIYISHPVPSGVQIKVVGVYGETGKILVELAETEGKTRAEQSGGAPVDAIALVFPQVPAADSRNILIRYDSTSALYLGKTVRTIEATCHPSTAYSGIRYFFKPTDPALKEQLFVDKGPTPIGEKVLSLNLKEGDLVMVTYIEPDKTGDVPTVIDVVQKPTVGMPGGPQ